MTALTALVRRLVDVRDDETPAMLWATLYGFFILFSYYILRAVRDEISSADRGNLQLLWTAVFLVMLVAVPLYSWVASRYQRGVFIPLVNRFFIACLVGFWAALHLLPMGARPWIDRAFYVWTSVFALFVVTVFWGFMADCFTNEQARRVFGFIAVGSSLGGIAGSAVTAGLAEIAPRFTLLLLACIPLEAASWCALVIHRRFAEGADGSGEEGKTRGREPSPAGARPLGGTALSGIGVIFRSRYLLGIAGFIVLMSFASTILYFLQANLVGRAIADRGARTAFFAQIDLAVNLLTILFQVYLTARIIKLVGIGVSLALVPLAVVLGFVTLGVYPLLAVLVVLQVAYRSGRYGITKPAREVLFTVVPREEKYKSKAFLDAAVYRGADLANGWAFAGLQALGLSLGAIALVAAPLAAVWAFLGLRLGSEQEERAGPGLEAAAARIVST
ncbi:MAG TPA: MFS transporter [Gemmatimonadota bacterium]|nr:MFS transporter [Gemmatimonadota bacterium]